MPYDRFWRARPLQYLAEFTFSLGLAVFSALAFGIRKIVGGLRQRRAEGWPMTSGTITTCNVKAVHGRFIDYALGQIGYSYEANGSYYSGYFVRQYNDEQDAWTFVDANRDRQLLVRYRLDDPSVSVLRETDQVGGFEATDPQAGRIPETSGGG